MHQPGLHGPLNTAAIQTQASACTASHTHTHQEMFHHTEGACGSSAIVNLWEKFQTRVTSFRSLGHKKNLSSCIEMNDNSVFAEK